MSIEDEAPINKVKEKTVMATALLVSMKEVMVIMIVTAIVVTVILLRRRL